MKKTLFSFFGFMLLSIIECMAQGYRLIDVEKVIIGGIGFNDNSIETIETKLGHSKSTFREYDEEMGVFKVSVVYDSISFEFTEVKKKIYLDYIEILSSKYILQVEEKSIRIGDRIDRLEKMFPLAYDNYEKNPDLPVASKDVFKVYLKYDDGGKWVFYGKIIFKLKGRVIHSIYIVYSPEF